MEKVPRNEADEVFYKQKDMISLTSSTASGPLDVCEANSTVACNMLSMGEGFGERSLVWVADGNSFCDRNDLGQSGRLSLRVRYIFFVWATDEAEI